jgi:hypothetical protein
MRSCVLQDQYVMLTDTHKHTHTPYAHTHTHTHTQPHTIHTTLHTYTHIHTQSRAHTRTWKTHESFNLNTGSHSPQDPLHTACIPSCLGVCRRPSSKPIWRHQAPPACMHVLICWWKCVCSYVDVRVRMHRCMCASMMRRKWRPHNTHV